MKCGGVFRPAFMGFTSYCCFENFICFCTMFFIHLLIIDSPFVNMEFHYPIHVMTFFIEMKNLHNVFSSPKRSGYFLGGDA